MKSEFYSCMSFCHSNARHSSSAIESYIDILSFGVTMYLPYGFQGCMLMIYRHFEYYF